MSCRVGKNITDIFYIGVLVETVMPEYVIEEMGGGRRGGGSVPGFTCCTETVLRLFILESNRSRPQVLRSDGNYSGPVCKGRRRGDNLTCLRFFFVFVFFPSFSF